MAATQTMPVETIDYASNKSPNYPYDKSPPQPFQGKNPALASPESMEYAPSVMTRSQLPPLNLSHMNSRPLNLIDRQSRQIHSPRSPMYVPAVLRPTEKPQRHSPPKSADTKWNKTNWAQAEETGNQEDDLTAIATEDIHDEDLGPVTGPPSTEHWKPDTMVSSCFMSSCQRSFSFFTRRHHCRRCGNIYCYEHIRNQAPLNQHALFHREGQESKVCDRCHTAYKRWQHRRSSRSDSDTSTNTMTSPSPAIACGANTRAASATTATNNMTVGSVAGSVGGYHWSTF